jgi:AraC family transcriptional regulator, ethanolamine operon transcriptional activator
VRSSLSWLHYASKIFIDDTPRLNPHVNDGRADEAELAGVIQSAEGAPLRAKT